jgi:hypothetical protein
MALFKMNYVLSWRSKIIVFREKVPQRGRETETKLNKKMSFLNENENGKK